MVAFTKIIGEQSNMDQVTKAMPGGLAALEEANRKASLAPPRQVLPEGFQAEKSLPLLVPVQWDGVTYSTVNFRRLKGKDYIALQTNADASVLSLVTGLPSEVIAEIDGEDFERLAEVAQDFLPPRLRAALGMISDDGRSSQA